MSRQRRGPTPRRIWQPLERAYYTNGDTSDRDGRTLWKNDVYTVIRLEAASTTGETDPAVYLSIRRNDRRPARDWRDFQRIKNQLAGPEYEGIELYPAESRLIDSANQYHLWCFPFQMPFGYNERDVQTQAVADAEAPGSVQRDPEEVDLQYGGITRGPDRPTLRWPGKDQLPS
jgi:hypothetical protein